MNMMATRHSAFRFAEIEVWEREFSIIQASETLAVEPMAFRSCCCAKLSGGPFITSDI